MHGLIGRRGAAGRRLSSGPKNRRVSRTVSRAALILVACLAVYSVAAVTVIRSLGGTERYIRRADFVIDLTGASILLEGKPHQLYDIAVQTRVQAELLRAVGYDPIALLPYNHPPPEAFLVAGLHAVGLSLPMVFAAWTAVSIGAYVLALVLLGRTWQLPAGSQAAVVCSWVAFLPVASGLLLGQSTGLLVVGLAGTSVALRSRRPGAAGVILCLVALKPPFMLIPLLALIRVRLWRAVVAAVVTLCVLTGIGMAWLGPMWPVGYAALLLSELQQKPSPAFPPVLQNWLGLFRALLGVTPAALIATAVATAATIATVVWVWRGPGGPRSLALQNRDDWDRRWALTLFASILVNPHVFPHDLAWTLVPGTMLAARAVATSSRMWVVWLWIGWAFGCADALFPAVVQVPAVLWMAATVALLAWSCAVSPASGRVDRAAA